MSESQYRNLKKRMYYLQTNTMAARRNVINAFGIYFHAKTTMSIECQRIWHEGGF